MVVALHRSGPAPADAPPQVTRPVHTATLRAGIGLLALVNDKIRAVPGVRETESSIHFKLNKQTYTWGTR